MLEKIKSIEEKIKDVSIKTKDELEQFRLDFIAKKGQINSLFAEFKSASPEDKKKLGSVSYG